MSASEALAEMERRKECQQYVWCAAGVFEESLTSV
jgi:hypothetical protein